MNKMIKVSPELARIIKSFGKSRTSLPSANGTKIVIRNPELLRIIRAFGKASNQVKSSPLSLRSADNANRTQASQLTANGTKIVITDPTLLRIIRAFGKASNQVKSSPLSLRSADNANYSEVQDLKDRIAKLTAEKEYLKGQYDQQKEQNKAFYDNLLAQHNNLNIRYGDLQNQRNVLRGFAANAIAIVQQLISTINGSGISRRNGNAKNALGQIQNFLTQI